MTTTTHEKTILSIIAIHEYNEGNGAEPTCADDVHTYCWADDFASSSKKTLTTKQVKGVLSSLVKKGLIEIYKSDSENNGVCFTEEGYSVYETIRANR